MAPFRILGGHFRNSPNSTSAAWQANTPTTKALDNVAYLDSAPPGAMTVFREYFGSQDITQPGYNAANEVIAALAGRRPTYVEGFNEVYQKHDLTLLAQYVDWTEQFTATCHAAGHLVAGFSFNTGWPNSDEWAYLRSRNFGGVDAIAMHAYWGSQGFTYQNALLFTTLWQTGDPQIILTECGRDCVDGITCSGPNCGNECGWNGPLQGPISAAQYVGKLENFDTTIAAYPFREHRSD